MELDKDGVEHEATFWKRFVTEERFVNGWAKNVRTPDLVDLVYDFVRDTNPTSILDVGSGPVSILYGTLVDVVTCDPLTEVYQSLVDFKALGLNPPEPYAAEDLPAEWSNRFDLVHCSNALDHTVDAFEAYSQLFRCVKPGGHLIVQGFTNEATFERQQGFHQWNIDLVGPGEAKALSLFHVKNNQHAFVYGEDTATSRLVLSKKLTLVTGKEWFVWIIQKI